MGTTETTNKTAYWLCKETFYMRGTKTAAFIEGEEYTQLKPIKNDTLTLRDESGMEHSISPEVRSEHFEEVKAAGYDPNINLGFDNPPL